MFVSKLKNCWLQLISQIYRVYGLVDHLEAKKHHKSRFHQYLIGLKVEICYYMTEISQNIKMLTSAFFENYKKHPITV